MSTPRYPALFQINTRVRLSEISAALERKATLDDIADEELGGLAAKGFDLIWLLGIWQTGEAARGVSQSNREWLEEYRRLWEQRLDRLDDYLKTLQAGGADETKSKEKKRGRRK